MSDWQPIETVPKDGTIVLFGRWTKVAGTIYAPRWTVAVGRMEKENYVRSTPSMQYSRPTHWAFMPEPPK